MFLSLYFITTLFSSMSVQLDWMWNKASRRGDSQIGLVLTPASTGWLWRSPSDRRSGGGGVFETQTQTVPSGCVLMVCELVKTWDYGALHNRLRQQ